MDSEDGTAGITLVCCGLIGTLVADDGLIERSFAEAIATQGIVSGTSAFARRMSQVHRARGGAPGDVLRVLFPDNEARAQAAQLAFEQALPEALGRGVIEPVPGAVEALEEIRDSGRQICVLTSFPRRVLDLVLRGADLGSHIDLALSREEAPRGFPAPDLALTAVLKAGAAAVQDVAMVHATGAGVECGRRSAARVVVGVLTGPHSATRLRGAGASHVIGSIAELPRLLTKVDPRPARAAPYATNGDMAADSHRRAPAAGVKAAMEVPSQVGERRRLEH
ncbi:MAG: HAD hydrolase-like protein [Actinobacteria bacterium]|nr:HAD hydrolase-like protein [Actinomycetota bacterium]